MEYHQKISHYKNIQCETANPVKLVEMLYARLEKELVDAKEYIVLSKFEDKCNAIVLSQEILLELNNSLNLEVGELAENLKSLYLYMYRELNLINFKNDVETLGKLIQISKNLHSSWNEIIQKYPQTIKETKSRQINFQNMSIVR